MITKEQLQQMSDFEVNKALAELIGGFAGAVGDWMPDGVKVNDESKFFYTERNYCNTPNDIMPLAFEHGMGLVQPAIAYRWQANWFLAERNYGVADHCFSHENPLRAIACCLILVLQEKQ